MSVTFDEWKFAAATLGLELYGKERDYETGLSFSSLARASEEPIERPAPDNTSMRGRWRVQAAGRTAEVLVLRRVVTLEKHSYYYTRVVARIARPLFVGLLLHSPRPLDPLFGTPNPTSGEHEIDGRFSFAAAYPREALAVLRRSVAWPNDVVDHLLAASERWHEVTITDTSVELQVTLTSDPAAIAPMLDAAAALATLLASRRPALPRNAVESTVLEALRGFGATTRLTFDGDTMAVRGHLGTVAAELRTECEEGRLFTVLTLAPARPLDLGLRVTRQGTFQFIATFFGSRDITIGDAEVDDTFVIKGRDEGAVRGFFDAHPEGRRSLVALAKVAGLRLSDAGLTVEWRTVLGEAELTALAARMPSLVALLEPSASTSPYR